MIDYSIKDGSCDDLQQYIMEYLLSYDNIKLNQMYGDKKLRNFISQMIKMQRNGGNNGNNTEYSRYLHIKNSNETFFDHIDIQDESTYDNTIDIIIEYIDMKSFMNETKTDYTSSELKSILSFTLLKKYFMSDLTHKQLAKHLHLSKSTTQLLMRNAKDDVLKFWKQKGQWL